MDDRTRTHGHAEGVELSEEAAASRSRLARTPYTSEPGLAGLVLGAMLAVMFGALTVAGLAIAVGAWPAVILATLAFGGLVWFLVPTAEPTNLHAERLLDDRGLVPSSGRAKTTPHGKHIRRGLTVACLGCVCGIVMSVVPGCGEANALAAEALDTNREQLDPMTLRGIADAESDGDISPALGEQYRGLLDDHNELIDALLGREPEQPVEVPPGQ